MMEYETLYLCAKNAVSNAYAPYSGFQVGAAILTSNDKIYTGVNVENSSYGATICAERTAAVKAVSDGELKFKAIAIAVLGQEASPCGVCRQFLYEFGKDMDVIFGIDEAHLHIIKLSDLLPFGFMLKKDDN